MAIPNRLAVSGEELVTHRFEAGAVGLASALDLRNGQDSRNVQSCGFWSTIKAFFRSPDAQSIPAVCVPPGARLLVRDIPARLQHECGFQDEVKEAVFTQMTAVENTFRDAVRFKNGVEVLLQRFDEGQRMCVLELSSAEERQAAPYERRHPMIRDYNAR